MVSMSRTIDSGVSSGKAEDVAAPGHTCPRLPGQQHLAIFADLVLPLLGAHQALGIDVLKPDEDRLQPARAAFSMKPGMRWQSVSTWMKKLNPQLLLLRNSISRSKIGSQLRLRAKLSSVTKKRVTPCAGIGAHDRLDVVGRAITRLATLDVDDGAEAALERAAAPGVEARIGAGGRLTQTRGRNGIGAASRSGRSFRKL